VKGTDVGACSATGESLADPGHVHTCIGKHDAGDHFCGECQRWWYRKFTPKPRVAKPRRKRA
jgi:hypothetical protein